MAHTVVVAMYCFSLCVAVFAIVHRETLVTLLILLFIPSLLFDKRTVVFIYTIRTWWLFSRSVVWSQMYITTVCVGFCLAGKGCGGPKFGWVSVCLSAGRVLVGAGWAGAFMTSGVLVRHRKFCWGLC